jgi:hypothetical protein
MFQSQTHDYAIGSWITQSEKYIQKAFNKSFLIMSNIIS